MAMQMAFDYDLDRPLFINPTHQFSRQGLDNPDAIYFNAYLKRGRRVRRPRPPRHQRRPVLPGDGRAVLRRLGGHLADGLRRPRARRTAADGTFEFTYVAEPGAKTMIVREVFNDWDTEERGMLTIERADTLGQPAKALTRGPAREEVRGRRRARWSARSRPGSPSRTSSSTRSRSTRLTAPQSTPGGLASQRSSIGHYELADDQALVVTVPRATDCAYQGDPDRLGLVRLHRLRDPPDLAHQGPGGHRPRRQDAVRDLRAQPGGDRELARDHRPPHRRADAALAAPRARPRPRRTARPSRWSRSPTYPTQLPHFTPITPEEYAARIAARQRSVARRMIS